MRILAISGSLRAASSNTAILRAAVEAAVEGMSVVLYEGLGSLPHFNPELDTDEPPVAVREYRAELQRADGVLFSTPEYAHGMPGTLKNALDWVVGSGEFMEKPVALINLAPRATFAQAALIETLTTMTARVVSEACVALQVTRETFSANGGIADQEIANALQAALRRFAEAIRAKRF